MPNQSGGRSCNPAKARPRILYADDDCGTRGPISRGLKRHFDTTVVRNADAAIRAIHSDQSFPVVVCGLRLTATEAIAFLERLYAGAPDTVAILLTDTDGLSKDGNLHKAACAFLLCDKMCPMVQMVDVVSAGIERHDARRADRRPRHDSGKQSRSGPDEADAGRPGLGLRALATSAAEGRQGQLLQRLRDPQFVEHVSCVYQPKWDIGKAEFAGMEALARWLDPCLGLISPGEFVPLAETDAEIAERLGEWVLLTACRQRVAWRGLVPDDTRVAVNISATELCSGKLHAKVMRCLKQVGLPARLLELEITESAAIVDLARSVEQLQVLRGDGVEIAIDDFGVGFSSLSYLGELPATSLKIDRSFLREIERGGKRANLLRAICTLGHAMGLTVVMEGVESLRTVGWLRMMGCDMVQGFALGRPLEPDAFAYWYCGGRKTIALALEQTASGAESDRLPRCLHAT